MTKFYHLLITIFNVKETIADDVNQLHQWTVKRYGLFEKYCLPSVLAQSEKNFEWLILIDSSTKPEVREKLEYLQTQHQFIFLVELNEISELVDGIRQFALRQKKSVEHIVTTRFDNDDLLHEDFIKKTQELVSKSFENRVINLEDGYTLKVTEHPYLLFKTKMQENPFISLVEPYNEEMLTVRKWIHNHWGKYLKVQNVTTTNPMWIQLIHRNNVSNDVMGKPVVKPIDLQHFQLKNKDASHGNKLKHHTALANNFIGKVKNKLTK